MKRDEIKQIIPGITQEQLDSIMNLHSADVGEKVNKISTLEAEKTTLTTQLEAANGKLEGYDPEWKTKAEQAKTDAANQLAEMQRSFAIEKKASSLKFSSESAKKAFLADARPSRPQTRARSSQMARSRDLPRLPRELRRRHPTRTRPQTQRSVRCLRRKVNQLWQITLFPVPAQKPLSGIS